METLPTQLAQKLAQYTEALENPPDALRQVHHSDLSQLSLERTAELTQEALALVGPSAVRRIYHLLNFADSEAEQGRNARYVLDKIIGDKTVAPNSALDKLVDRLTKGEVSVPQVPIGPPGESEGLGA